MKALGWSLLLLFGCSTAKEMMMEELQSAVDGYNSAYRWKNFERAAGYLPNDLRGPFIAAYEEDDNSIHIETYQIIKVDLESDIAATVTVRVRYLMLPSINLENRMMVQHWHKLDGSWILETEDNSIRIVDPNSLPKNPEAVEGVEVPPEQKGDTAIEVSDPKGNVIRKEGEVEEKPN